MRRVICGQGNGGVSTILQNEPLKPVALNRHAGPHSDVELAWIATTLDHDATDRVPSLESFEARLDPGEVRFMLVTHSPGYSSRMHRTPYTTDYVVVLSGETAIDMEDGTSVDLKPGDTVVQLGGFHRWRTVGGKPCVVAALMVGINPERADLPEREFLP